MCFDGGKNVRTELLLHRVADESIGAAGAVRHLEERPVRLQVDPVGENSRPRPLITQLVEGDDEPTTTEGPLGLGHLDRRGLEVLNLLVQLVR